VIVVDASALLESSSRRRLALADLADLDIHRPPDIDLLSRAWKLRGHVTAYDTMYIALAEALDAPIVTCDTPLAKVPGHRARIAVIE
jgi:predicted nucleic acid-binding protein